MKYAKKDQRVTHPLYGNGIVEQDSVTVDTNQWSGVAAWCIFHNPKTAISSGWPYMVPVDDLTDLINHKGMT